MDDPFPIRSKLGSLGVFIHADNNRIMARTVTGKLLSDDQRQMIRSNKEALLVELTKPRLWRGQLIIPSGCADKYQWWRGGQSPEQTRQEVTP